MGDITGGLKGPRLPGDSLICMGTHQQFNLYVPPILRDTAEDALFRVKHTGGAGSRSELISAVFMRAYVEFDGVGPEDILARYRDLTYGNGVPIADSMKKQLGWYAPLLVSKYLNSAVRSTQNTNFKTSRGELVAATFMLASSVMNGFIGDSILRRYRTMWVSEIVPRTPDAIVP
ncbi:MAG TPA: hypothetical protein VLG47_07625 [Candidatus Saccharimonadales bacterium]|nr:hypothetical protein [Candidatus Saccharimonadales bacterium]